MARLSEGPEPTIWFNVTTSAKWKRSPVGIVRVEQELLHALGKLVGNRLRQIVFEDGAFVPYSKNKILRDAEDFWPALPTVNSLDPFDPIKAKLPANQTPIPDKKPQFRSGDVLISVGLDWELAGFYERIYHDIARSGLTVITCCYDLIPIHYPQYCVGDVAAWFKNYLIDMSWAAHGVLCISENTKRDYVRFAEEIGLPQRSTKVIKLGSSLREENAHDTFSDDVKKILEERYFLFVSTIERRKNHAVLYRAYHLLAAEHPELHLPKLVFVGMQGWGVEGLLSDIRLDPMTKGLIQFMNHVSDAELAALYRGCEAFLFPSFYEGWGLPIAEALELGRPVLASAAGSIPEVGGDLVRYVDPWSPRDWAKELLSIIMDEKGTADWSRKTLAEFRPNEWNSAAVQVLDLIRELRADKSENRVLYPGYDLSTMSGVHYGDKLIFLGPEGVLCHGPYWALAVGAYSVSFHLTLVSGDSGNLRLSVRSDGGDTVHAKKVVQLENQSPGSFEIKLDFELTEYSGDVEFVVEVISLSKIKISLDKVELRNSSQ